MDITSVIIIHIGKTQVIFFMKNLSIRTDIAKRVIDELGGIKSVNEIFPDLSQPSISFWKVRGIPIEKERYLRVVCPELDVWKQYPFKVGSRK